MISYQFYKISSNTISGISRAYVDVLNLHIQGPRGPSLICSQASAEPLAPWRAGQQVPPAKVHQDHQWQVHKKMRLFYEMFMRCFTRCLPLKMGRIYEKKWRHTDDTESRSMLGNMRPEPEPSGSTPNAPHFPCFSMVFRFGKPCWWPFWTCPEGNGCYPGWCNCTRRKHRPGRPGWERSTKIWDSAITTWPHMPHGNGNIAGP